MGGDSGGVFHSEQHFVVEDPVSIYHSDQASTTAGAKTGVLGSSPGEPGEVAGGEPPAKGGVLLRPWLLGMLTHKLARTYTPASCHIIVVLTGPLRQAGRPSLA